MFTKDDEGAIWQNDLLRSPRHHPADLHNNQPGREGR
jgi:hypothetical protein